MVMLTKPIMIFLREIWKKLEEIYQNKILCSSKKSELFFHWTKFTF